MTSTDNNSSLPLDPQIKSLLTSAGMYVAALISGYAVHAGIVSAADQSNLTNVIVAVGGGLAAILFAYIKARMVTQKAMIQAVNTGDNGVKVVPATSPTPPVNEPQKGN